MRSFFVQIFLSFWISSLAIFMAAMVFFPRPEYSYESLMNALQVSVDQLARLEIEQGSTHDCDNLRPALLLILNERGEEICGKAAPVDIEPLVARVRALSKRQFARVGSFWAVAQPIKNVNGQARVALLLTPYQRAGWFPRFPPLALPISALVTFIFAYLLTNPVRGLRRAFRQFAAGDLSVRLPVARSPLRDWGGADIRTLMIDFNEMADRIQALLNAHKTLLRDVSHELRSPLARLNVALELAREEAGQSTEALDRAELESNRLNALIGELLSLSLMETLQDVPAARNIDLGSLVENLMPDLVFEAEARRCRVVHNQRGACPVLGSEEVLRRALENVIRNAIRHSPPDGTVVIETFREAAREESTGVVRICDSGPGVPEESLEAIFRPFYRVDSARQTTTGGFGVGLAIADRAVQIHGGTIQAQNRADGGLCVEFRFPCAHSGAA